MVKYRFLPQEVWWLRLGRRLRLYRDPPRYCAGERCMAREAHDAKVSDAVMANGHASLRFSGADGVTDEALRRAFHDMLEVWIREMSCR